MFYKRTLCPTTPDEDLPRVCELDFLIFDLRGNLVVIEAKNIINKECDNEGFQARVEMVAKKAKSQLEISEAFLNGLVKLISPEIEGAINIRPVAHITTPSGAFYRDMKYPEREYPFTDWGSLWAKIASNKTFNADLEGLLKLHRFLVALRCLNVEHHEFERAVSKPASIKAGMTVSRILVDAHIRIDADNILNFQHFKTTNLDNSPFVLPAAPIRQALRVVNLTRAQDGLFWTATQCDTHKWLMLTGGPGTGKTLMMELLIYTLATRPDLYPEKVY